MTTKPYNDEFVYLLTTYAKRHRIAQLTLHAYEATVDKIDDEGYTCAHNSDVAEMVVGPDGLGSGIEALVAQYKTDVTISSKVTLRDGSIAHIPMLDMAIPVLDPMQHSPIEGFFFDLSRFLQRTMADQDLFGSPHIYVSGNSYHVYGLAQPPFLVKQFEKLVGAILVCDHDKMCDHAWLGFSLGRGEFRLRLTKVQPKYKMLPQAL